MTILKPKFLIAIDPSLCSIGVSTFLRGNLENIYSIKPKINTEDEYSRHLEIVKSIRELMNINKKQILESDNYLAIESQYINFGAKFISTVLKTSVATGVIIATYMNYMVELKKDFKVISVAPLEAKVAVGVRGKLKRKESKAEVKRMVHLLYPQCREIKSQDVIDSIAIGLAGVGKIKFI